MYSALDCFAAVAAVNNDFAAVANNKNFVFVVAVVAAHYTSCMRAQPHTHLETDFHIPFLVQN